VTCRIHLLTIVCALLATVPAAAQPAVTSRLSHLNEVQTTSGPVIGAADDDVVAFKGIPYAAPPVGALRWRPPQPAATWTQPLVAGEAGPICMQKYNAKDNGVGPLPMSEDCLTLNVWRPFAETAKPLPVMVWIHGGGFVNGSGTAALYDGSALARQGLVVVTINYRLGRFGFFAAPALVAEADGGPVGDYGLMDQIATLKWVRDNIAGFGGDPGQVTIFGESAGGMSINRLMISPAARGLFQRAISESGLGREYALRLQEANAMGAPSEMAADAAFAKTMGVSGDDAVGLRAIPAEKILAAGEPAALGPGGGPIIDGQLLTMDVADAFAKGLEAHVPYIVGSNSLEFPVPPAMIDHQLETIVHLSQGQRAKIAAAYGGQDAYARNIVSDVIFTEPARHLAALHAKNGQPTWLYRFSMVSASMRGVLKGAVHASERQYVFQTLNASPWPTDEADKALAAAMSAYWASFAKAGNPNGGGRSNWPQYSARQDRLLDFTDDGPLASPVPYPERLDAIAAAVGPGR